MDGGSRVGQPTEDWWWCGSFRDLDAVAGRPDAERTSRLHTLGIMREALTPACRPNGKLRAVTRSQGAFGNVDMTTGATAASPAELARYRAFMASIESEQVVEIECGAALHGLWVVRYRGNPAVFASGSGPLER